MERRNDISNLLAIYIRNTREIYDITTWLQNCLIKKINNGIQPQVIVSENEFYKELYSLPLNEQKTHMSFIREQLSHYNNL